MRASGIAQTPLVLRTAERPIEVACKQQLCRRKASCDGSQRADCCERDGAERSVDRLVDPHLAALARPVRDPRSRRKLKIEKRSARLVGRLWTAKQGDRSASRPCLPALEHG